LTRRTDACSTRESPLQARIRWLRKWQWLPWARTSEHQRLRRQPRGGDPVPGRPRWRAPRPLL